MLATSWKPNKDATVWTFQLRKGVRFHNGKEMTSADVVASMKQYVGQGIERGPQPVLRSRWSLGRRPVRRAFPAEGAVRHVPLPPEPDDVPGDHPAGGDRGEARHLGEERHDRHGRVQAQELHARRRVPSSSGTHAYWGGRPALDGVKVTFFTGSAPLVLALRGGQIDLAMQLSPQEAQVFKNNSKYIYYSQPVSAHRQFCMRTDHPAVQGRPGSPSLALTINRPQQTRAGDARARPHRQRQPVLEEVRVDRSVDQAADAEPPAREGPAGGGGSRRT